MEQYDIYLRDLRWKLKRKRVLERDDFKCTVCGSKKSLHVHHTYYYRNEITPPWEYPMESLITVCEDCHKEFHMTCNVEIRDRPVDVSLFQTKDSNKPLEERIPYMFELLERIDNLKK